MHGCCFVEFLGGGEDARVFVIVDDKFVVSHLVINWDGTAEIASTWGVWSQWGLYNGRSTIITEREP